MTQSRTWPRTWIGWTTYWENQGRPGCQSSWLCWTHQAVKVEADVSWNDRSASQVVAVVGEIRKFVKEQFISQRFLFCLLGGRRSMQKKWRYSWGNARVTWASLERGVGEGERRREGEVVCETVTEDHSKTAAMRRAREKPAGVSSGHWPSSPCCFN